MAFDPFAAVRPDLLFPHGHNLLQAINAVTRSLKTALVTVGSGTGDQHSRFAHFKVAYSLHNSDPLNKRPASAYLGGDLLHLCQGHRLVGFVFKSSGADQFARGV